MVEYESMDVNDNIAKNLVYYRKSLHLTQADLAEKINYSDKSISKWERGESVPEIGVLKDLADFFGVKVDTLLQAPPKVPKPRPNLSKKRIVKCMIVAGFVWLVAIACFTFWGIIFPTQTKTWLSFIYAIPITLVILLVLTSIWGKNLINLIFVSLFIWTSLLAIFLSFIVIPPIPNYNIWKIFLIGIPLQALALIWYFYKRINKNV